MSKGFFQLLLSVICLVAVYVINCNIKFITMCLKFCLSQEKEGRLGVT